MRSSDQSKDVFLKNHDKEIYTSKHDDIVLWLYKKLKSPEYIIKTFKIKDYKSHKVVIEYPIGSKSLVYADLALIYYYEKESEYALFVFNDPNCYYDPVKTNSEKRKFIGPYLKPLIIEANDIIYFEVKTSLNIGETVRQINHAKTKFYAKKWVVCSPPDLRVSTLVEQNIGYIPFILQK